MGLNFDEACRSVIEKATCEQYLATSTLEQNDACFKPCGENAATCLPDAKIKLCANGGEVIANCSWICDQRNGSRYVGTCGLTFQGTPSPTGMDVCWCTL
jgi:hypothetical protein